MEAQARWVPDTRFGGWFQRTSLWQGYVVEPALASLHRLLGAAAPEPGVARVLDAGCGAGGAFAGLESRFRPRAITAVEIDPRMVAAASAAAARCSCEIAVLEADVESLELPAASFDVILCHQTLHHLGRPGAALAGFVRLLRPGGALLLAESCQRFTQSLPIRALFRHPRGGPRSAEEYLCLVREAGFELHPEQVLHPDRFWARADLGLLERFTGRRVPPAEPAQLLLVARRPAAG